VARKATYHWQLTTGHYSFPYRGGFMSKLPRFSFQVGLMLAFVMASLVGLAAQADPGPEPQPAAVVSKANPAADDLDLLASAGAGDASTAIDGLRSSDHPTFPGLILGRLPGVQIPDRAFPPRAVSRLSPAQPPGAGAGTPLFIARATGASAEYR
jgi:hypothetical protein